MTPAPAAMRPEDDLADVVALMLDARLRSVPIVEDGKLVGIITRRDVLRVVARRELTSEDVSRRRFEVVGGGCHPGAKSQRPVSRRSGMPLQCPARPWAHGMGAGRRGRPAGRGSRISWPRRRPRTLQPLRRSTSNSSTWKPATPPRARLRQLGACGRS